MDMIYITQLIYVNTDQEQVFAEFERLAIPFIAKHNGTLMLRVRPSDTAIIESAIEAPYEVHIVQFGSNQDLENFMADPARKAFLHLKDQSIREAILIKGELV